jgi:hypothetical protein
MEEVYSSETPVDVYQITLRDIPKDNILYSHYLENIKSHNSPTNSTPF